MEVSKKTAKTASTQTKDVKVDDHKEPRKLSFKSLEIAYGSNKIFTNFELSVPIPGVTALVGPSGCGKSTLLKVIAGLHPYQGKFNCPFQKNEIGLLFQDDELLPWEDIFTNIALGLKFRKIPKPEIEKNVAKWLKRIRLSGFEQRYPASLSGGQRKRVAIAQCLILAPKLLLLDEPFSSLDAIVRRDIVDFIFGWIRKNSLNAILVTHDLDEAVSIADKIVILSEHGKIVQQMEVKLEGDLPSRRKASKDFGNVLGSLWKGMEKSISVSLDKV